MYVFHYAAQVSAPRSLVEPVEDARTDMLGTVNILHASTQAEQYLATFWNQYKLRYAAVRLANVYGPRQDRSKETRVVAMSLERMLNGRPPIIHGDGFQVRDYVYVDDVVDANLRIAAAPGCGAYNIGTGTGTTVKDPVSILARAPGYPHPPVYGALREGDIRCSILDASRADRELGWKPRHGLEESLNRTADWYREHR